MISIKLFATKMWLKLLRPIWSFFINCCFMVTHLGDRVYISNTRQFLLNIPLNEVMKQFIWKADNYKDWVPWISTIIINAFEDDCDGAATLAKWWMESHGMGVRIINLYSADLKTGHTICMSSNNGYFVSNKEIVNIDPADWKGQMLASFENRYTYVIE